MAADREPVFASRICAGCNRELTVGDRYIEDTPSGFLKIDSDGCDGIIAGIFGGSGSNIIYCADCTEPGGDYLFETVGDESANSHAQPPEGG